MADVSDRAQREDLVVKVSSIVTSVMWRKMWESVLDDGLPEGGLDTSPSLCKEVACSSCGLLSSIFNRYCRYRYYLPTPFSAAVAG